MLEARLDTFANLACPTRADNGAAGPNAMHLPSFRSSTGLAGPQRPMPSAAKPPRWLFALWALALTSVLLRLHITLLNDRDGGVVAIGLKRAPSFRDALDSSTEAFRAQGNYVLLGGNENGVLGMELVQWHSRYGWFILCASACVATYAWWRRRCSVDT